MSPSLTTCQADGQQITSDAEAEIVKDGDTAAAVEVVEDAVLKGSQAEQDMTLRFAIGFCMPMSLTKDYLKVWEVCKALQARREEIAYPGALVVR